MSVAARNGFPAVALLLFASLLWAVAWYWSTASSMAGIWWRSETFAHGLVVLPISAWLIWRRRHRLAPLHPAPTLWMLIPMALAGLLWLLGELVRVNALSFFALVMLVVSAGVGLLGWKAARVLAFPLLFLFFAVPVGEFLLPVLMRYTADFTVLALRVSGVPVYQEGLFFVIPNGRWSVVEACSGLRYLIASVMVGTLYAYLNYVSLRRRLLFVAVAIAVPIVANWMRAYFIVMLGYLTDNRLAAGVDHIVYGWVFFGVVILLMFWIGACWREEAVSPAQPVTGSTCGDNSGRRGAMVRALPFFAVMALFPPLHQSLAGPVAPFEVNLQPPPAASGWTPVAQRPFAYEPRFVGDRGRVYQSYRNQAGQTVSLFMAYYARQSEGRELVTWSNRLTSRTDNGHWMRVLETIDSMPPGRFRRTVLADEPRRLAIWHAYMLGDDRLVVHGAEAKARIAWAQLSGAEDGAAFVAVITPTRERGEAERELVGEFLEAHGESIVDSVSAARRQHE